jgi:hypothetical protein
MSFLLILFKLLVYFISTIFALATGYYVGHNGALEYSKFKDQSKLFENISKYWIISSLILLILLLFY